MLDILKLELDIHDSLKDALLQRYLDKATQYIVDYTRQDKAYVEEAMQNTVIDLATLAYNRRGAEGLQAQSVSGISETYTQDIPQYIKKQMKQHRKLV